MGNWYVLWQMGKARQQELIKEAQQFRRVQEAREAGRRGKGYIPVYGVLLRRLGEQLISWGSYLSKRFPAPRTRKQFGG